MRTVVLAAVAALALAVTGASQPASQATKAVAIKATGFSPKSVTIASTGWRSITEHVSAIQRRAGAPRKSSTYRAIICIGFLVS